jgi:hypothetical protein
MPVNGTDAGGEDDECVVEPADDAPSADSPDAGDVGTTSRSVSANPPSPSPGKPLLSRRSWLLLPCANRCAGP